MSKHILVISQYYYPENFRINDITREWVKRGYQVTVITGIPNYPKGRFFKGYGFFRKRKEVIEGVKVIRLATIPRFSNSIFLALNYISFVISGWFWAKFARIKADYVFNFEVSPMTQALPAIWYAKKRKIPSYIYVQDLWPENLQIVGGVNNTLIIKKVDKMVDYIYKNATKILVTSNSFKDSVLKREIDKNKCIVWYQYAEDFYQPLEKKVDDQKLTIIFTGNIGEAQGLEILPQVALELKKLNYSEKIKFSMVGNGRNKENLIKLVKTYNVAEMFDFTDAVAAKEVPLLLSKADVAFLSFQNNELFQKTIPAKLQSYLSCGMPILAVASGETKKIVEDAKCGLVSNPGDIQQTVENIIQYLSFDENTMKLMSENSINYSNKWFNKKSLMDEMDSIFRRNIDV
jgi:glycosyltransferase involved in cell wall biosynthesis